MPILARHYAGRFLAHFFGALMILAAFLVIVELLLDLEEILEAETTFLGILGLVVTRITAFYLPYLVPFAAFIGAFLTAGLAARAREITAMKAGGISPMSVAWAMLAIATWISVVSFVVDETAVRWAESDLRSRETGEATTIAVRHGRIWYHTGRYIYNIQAIDGHVVRGVRLYERDELGRLARLIEARSGRETEPSRWRFDDATLRTFDPDRPRTPPTVTEADQVEIALAPERSPNVLRESLLEEPIWVLLGEAGDTHPSVRATIHQRLSQVPLSLAFVLLAIPLGFSVERVRNLAKPALEGSLAIGALLSMREYAAKLAGADGGAWLLWATLIGFALYAGFRLLRIDR